MRTLRIVNHECNPVTNIDQSIDVSKICAVYLQGIPPNDGDEILRTFLTSAGHPLATSFPENPRTMLNPLDPDADPAIGGLCGWGHYQSSAGAQWAYAQSGTMVGGRQILVSYMVRKVATDLNTFDNTMRYVPLTDPLPAVVPCRTVTISRLDPNANEEDLRNFVVSCQQGGPGNRVEWYDHGSADSHGKPTRTIRIRFETRPGALLAYQRYRQIKFGNAGITEY